MKFKQITTVVYTQEVELTEEEAQEIIGIPSIREKEISENLEADLLSFIFSDLDSTQNLSVDTKINIIK